MATGTKVDLGGDDLVINNLTVGAGTPGAAGTTVFSGTSLSNVTVSGTLTSSTITLAAGTTSVAPLKFASGTNLATATAGAEEFDGTVFYLTAVGGARQLNDAEQYIRQVGDGSSQVTSGLDSTAAAPVFAATTSGAITLASNTAYCFEGVYLLTNTGTAAHTWSTLFGGTATSQTISYSVSGISATTNAPTAGGLTGYATTAAAVVVTTSSTSATENVTVFLTGIINVATTGGGTFIPQMKASARPGGSGTAGVVVKDGSFFRIWPLGTQATTNVGNWS